MSASPPWRAERTIADTTDPSSVEQAIYAPSPR